MVMAASFRLRQVTGRGGRERSPQADQDARTVQHHFLTLRRLLPRCLARAK
jgi:hypothetical protein